MPARLSLKTVALANKGLAISFLNLSLHVDSVSEVLHRLAEDRVVHELEKVLFEIGCGLLPELGVQGNVGLHPRPLLELEDFVDLPQPHPKIQVLLEGSVVQDVPGFVLQG